MTVGEAGVYFAIRTRADDSTFRTNDVTVEGAPEISLSNTVWYVDAYAPYNHGNTYPRWTECTLVDSTKTSIPSLTSESSYANKYSGNWTYSNAPTMYNVYNNGATETVITQQTNGTASQGEQSAGSILYHTTSGTL